MDLPVNLEDIRSSLEKAKGMTQGRNVYAQIARVVFEEIKALRAENTTLLGILEILEADGHLPDGSNTKALSKALKREDVRRRKNGQDKDSGGVKASEAKKPVSKLPDKAPSPDMTDDERAEKERLRKLHKKLNLPPVDIGIGVRKLPGGGFDFD
jgi:hypothetical protein